MFTKSSLEPVCIDLVHIKQTLSPCSVFRFPKIVQITLADCSSINLDVIILISFLIRCHHVFILRLIIILSCFDLVHIIIVIISHVFIKLNINLNLFLSSFPSVLFLWAVVS